MITFGDISFDQSELSGDVALIGQSSAIAGVGSAPPKNQASTLHNRIMWRGVLRGENALKRALALQHFERTNAISNLVLDDRCLPAQVLAFSFQSQSDVNLAYQITCEVLSVRRSDPDRPSQNPSSALVLLARVLARAAARAIASKHDTSKKEDDQ